MKVKGICPASCGELLQGIIGKGEKLISYPINIYSSVTVEEKKAPVRDPKFKKAINAMYKTIDYFGLHKSVGDTLSIKVDSNIPIEKGMASSTADIAATVAVTAKLIGKEISLDELAKICTQIEPTDSTIFHTLTLFDHLNGVRINSFDWDLNLDILILESQESLNTQVFRRKDYSCLRAINKPKVEKAYEIFKLGYEKRDPSLLGKAATISALANQNILYKEKLEEIVDISLKLGCYGVNVAHSGTVLGIIFEKNKIHRAELVDRLQEKGVYEYYYKYYFAKMVKGGVSIVSED
ncbi:cobalamin biosynthesis protein [Crassaminicella indica]|uniref:Cobalamin biosynthesis protein n=1 Tax=Crassaminicella indica TaxID=2855394 RepID=A0ABX8R9A7_9CLOT|nr:cobalamin biosynthesis protein [Crassaminicella indica]QXM05648.1 cobalamin biosynthesis protein [Crassaminicella indica]